VRQTKSVKAAIAAIGDDAWTYIHYPDGGVAQADRPRNDRRGAITHDQQPIHPRCATAATFIRRSVTTGLPTPWTVSRWIQA
jgi:hypothetical protein